LSFRDFLRGATDPRRAPDGALAWICTWLPKEVIEAQEIRQVGLWTITVQYLLGEPSLWRSGEGAWLAEIFINTARLLPAFERLLGEPIQGQFLAPRNTRAQSPEAPLDDSVLYGPDELRWAEQADGVLQEAFDLSPFGATTWTLKERAP